jgi:long-chain acyl-CoA synthetase
MSLGAVHVPIYPNLSPEEFEFILGHSAAKLIFVCSESLYRVISPIQKRFSALEVIFTYDPVKDARQWTEIRDLGQKGLDEGNTRADLQAIKEGVWPEDLATLIYTSGTTGAPKGVMLSHANLLSNCFACAPLLQRVPLDRTLSFLPLCHVFERTMINLYVNSGVSIYYAENLSAVGENLREVKPTYFSTVPRVLEKIFEAILARGNELTGVKRKIFSWAVRLAQEFKPGSQTTWKTRFRLALADRLVFKRWRAALGGRIHAISCGSAPLQPRVAAVFWAAGMPIHEGYGLTEASPVISTNYQEPGKVKVGTAGPIIPDGEVKIAQDGEILYRGPNVMMGYYRQPDLTAEAIDSDGWLHTGDVGEFDGIFLRITDRKKEMFKTSGGKYIAPQQLENKILESKFIVQIMVVGENRKFPGALIVPAFAVIATQFKQKRFQSNTEMIADPEVIALIESEIRRANTQFSQYMQIKRIVLLSEEWSVATGELTPTLKQRRKRILEKYAKEVESIYTNPGRSGLAMNNRSAA